MFVGWHKDRQTDRQTDRQGITPYCKPRLSLHLTNTANASGNSNVRKTVNKPNRNIPVSIFVLFFLAVMPLIARAQNSSTEDFNKFSFSITNRIMDDGIIQDVGLGMEYTNVLSWEFRIRRTKTEKNEEFEGLQDSLNAAGSDIYEVFLIPVKYSFFNTQSAKVWAGIGGYYYDEKLKEKGFFNMPQLTSLGMEPLNSYTNKFSMRTLGPILDVGAAYRDSNWFNVTLSAGVVPVFATWAKQKVSIVPLMAERADNSQSNSGSPYLYCDLNWTLSLPQLKALFRNEVTPSDWKIGFSLLFDYYRLQFETLDFDYDGSRFNWYIPERKVTTRSLKLEGMLLIPLGGVHLQIGAGRIFDSVKVDSGAAIRGNKNYFYIGAGSLNFKSLR